MVFFRFCEHHQIRFQTRTQVCYNRKPYSNGTVDPCLKVADFQLYNEKILDKKSSWENLGNTT